MQFRAALHLFLCRVFFLIAAQLFCAAVAPSIARGDAASKPIDPQLEVDILSPEDGATLSEQLVTLQVLVRTPPGTSVRLHPVVNGQRMEAKTRGMVVKSAQQVKSQGKTLLQIETLRTLEFQIPAADCTVSVIAETASGWQTSREVRLNWRSTERFMVKPKLYVLAVGISAYKDSELALEYASKDADDFAKAFMRQQGGLYEQVTVQILLDGMATRDRILDGLQWLQRQTTAKDVAILFLAGHGIDDPSNGVYYFLPHDADHSAVMRSMISQQSLQTVLRSIAGKTLLFLDTCHAANVMNGAQGRAVSNISHLINELAEVDNGLVVYAAASGRQLSQESRRWNNGVFTKAVVEGLSGRAAYHADRPITAQMLNLYVSERVKELTGGVQTPIMVTSKQLADFPLALGPQRPAVVVVAPPPWPPMIPPPPMLSPPPYQPAIPTSPMGSNPPPMVWTPPPRVFTPSIGFAPRPRAPFSQVPMGFSPRPPQPQSTDPAATEVASTPVYRKVWFWLTIGGATALVGGLAIYGGIRYSAANSGNQTPDSQNPNVTMLTFTKVE
jgi:hypothetical protein